MHVRRYRSWLFLLCLRGTCDSLLSTLPQICYVYGRVNVTILLQSVHYIPLCIHNNMTLIVMWIRDHQENLTWKKHHIHVVTFVG